MNIFKAMHYTTGANQGDSYVNSVCGLELSTWDVPIEYTFKAVETTCSKCWELKARNEAIQNFLILEKAAQQNYESILQAKVLIEHFLKNEPLIEKAIKWIKEHWAYNSKFSRERYLKE